MKQTLLSVAALFCIATGSFATTHTITASGTSFSPSSGVTVNLGDTVKWVLGSGSHTSTSTSVPSGAATWDQTLSSTPFIYVPTVAGTYTYQCNFHVSMGMTGTFTVVGSAGIAPVSAVTPLFSMFPNPASKSVHLMFNDPSQPVSVRITDMAGKLCLANNYDGASGDIDVKSIPSGIYVIAATQGGKEYKQEVQVTH